MSLDERGRQAAEDLRARVVEDLPTLEMLTSLQRTRGRRRLAMVVPVAAAAVAVVAVLTGSPAHEVGGPASHPRPSAPTSAASAAPTSPSRGNGVLFGVGETYLRAPRGVYSPVLHDGSSPTWSPNGDEIAVLDGGILITEAYTGAEHRLPCPRCTEIAWSPDGGSFAAPGVGGSPLGLVDAATGRRDARAPGRSPGRAIRDVVPGQHAAGVPGDVAVVGPGCLHGRTATGRASNRSSTYPTVLAQAPDDLATMLAVRWAPTWGRLAVLFAEPATPAGYRGAAAPVGADLPVRRIRPEPPPRPRPVLPVSGFQPNLVWSPDGTTLAVYAQHARSTTFGWTATGEGSGSGSSPGSGPLSWQPLPLVR